ncbi:MAG TPA: hypothetical protein VGE85_11425 [Terracidiphilus sp.]|jgi:hypothetical protein
MPDMRGLDGQTWQELEREINRRDLAFTVAAMLHRGDSVADIHQALQSRGWSEAEIEDVSQLEVAIWLESIEDSMVLLRMERAA